MSRFHSPISRRDFMKALGFTGAGLGGVAALTSPAFHDLDELMSSNGNYYGYEVGDGYIPNLPWYVKHKEYYEPTVPIDWDHKWRVDGRHARDYNVKESKWFFDAYSLEQAKKYVEWQQGYDPKYNWKDPRRQALDSASQAINSFVPKLTFLGQTPTKTPEKTGYPKWTGTPKENMNLLRGIARFFGCDDIGVIEDGPQLERLTTTYDMESAKIDRENVEAPYVETNTKGTVTRKVIPTSFKWSFVWTFRQNIDMTRVQQGGIMKAWPDYNPLGAGENAAVWYCYSRMSIIEIRLMQFIRALGYDCVAGGMSAITSGTALATVNGLLEHARMGQVALHPKYGATVRSTYKMWTNMPLVPTRPIDAGIYEFCKTCEICAEACPGQVIQRNDPTWTTGRNPEDGNDNGTFGEPLPYQAQGFLGWRTDIGKCPHCPMCQGTCPFNEMPEASWLHTLVKATAANTTVFNKFFADMDRTFKYGHKLEADYFDERFGKMPTYGIDTMR
ncbi:reductive dehalogenase [Dehalogenimonas alkenigignens]|uniref:Reductive dehalogenase n=2 Tax=Dehalogenimonas alkenigignens TaxID=1217799 RepID=A0A0W0GKJ3_9CHLR|nr:reductive dehalogenase [Dehalogenimonas alkenigignens]KTB49057.1 reductive dehalogenase [Dehalogenimonas alkenigignens]PVV83165.1 reductive dehalogenase [Dehalogenimonas alkenigignens]